MVQYGNETGGARADFRSAGCTGGEFVSEIYCKNCAFYSFITEDDAAGIGVCHRYPPIGELEDEEDALPRKSYTAADYWCGEFRISFPSKGST